MNSANPRRFAEGQTFYIPPVHYRVVSGYKGPKDLRLEWRCAGQWRAVPMAHAALHADFFYENEDLLYSPPAAGGNYFLGFIHQATREGWDVAVARLEDEKRGKGDAA